MAAPIHLEVLADLFNKIGHSRPTHSVPVPTDVRYAPESGSEIKVLAPGMTAG